MLIENGLHVYACIDVWQSDIFEYQCQIAQLLEYMTRDSGSQGSNTSLIHHYFSHSDTIGAMTRIKCIWMTDQTRIQT